MSREIKFRLWDEDAKEMIGGDDLAFEEYDLLKNWLSQDGIMQFTGLKDANGKEIYEGDIVKVKKVRGITIDYGFFEMTGQVFYYNGSYCIGGQDVLLSSMKPIDIEVIGNIYENPELLGNSNV